ncbi:conserved hypothetical protein [Paecilomyces variotii No. 5]|uniref:Uncharacterized protein n=1 Tax=Byssochlamys spectabilis (strain No. 5 / NBRC 109023) TaxID=1356009 RepID=V5FXW2_BYSSN|nr:conserved hypothetical protein [Paecilomyces variotii No. 5]
MAGVDIQSLGIDLPPGYSLQTAAARPDMYETLFDPQHPMSSLWPQFITSTPVSERYWAQLTTIPLFASYQLIILHQGVGDKNESVVACGNSIPVYCPLNELPDGGWEAILQTGIENYHAGHKQPPNLLSALGVTVHPAHRQQRLADILIQTLRSLASQFHFEALVVPLRPTKKSEYPLVPFEEYVHWKLDDHARPADRVPYDPWLRKHLKYGGQIVRIAPHSMTITAHADQWKDWTGCDLTAAAESGLAISSEGYIEVPVPRALVPVQYNPITKVASYVEPNKMEQQKVSFDHASLESSAKAHRIEHEELVTYHNLDYSRLIPEVLGYSYLRDIADEGKKQSPGKQHARVIQAYSKIHTLLSPARESAPKDSNIRTQWDKHSHVVLHDERGAFIERLEPPPNSKADVVNTVFAQVNLQTPTGPPLEQFVNCRSSNIKENDLKASASGICRPVIISTGICLFSSRLLGFIPTKGPPNSDDTKTTIPPLPYGTAATFYEIETCTRMAMTIAGLAVTASTGGTTGGRPIVVRLDVPRLQYYCYPLELLQAGLVSWEYVQEWFKLIDRRHRQIATLLKDTITHEVLRRGGDVRVEVTAGSIAAIQLLRLSVLDRRVLPSVNDMLFVLQWIGPYQAAWREFLALIDESQRPRNLRTLSLLAYVFEVIYPGLHLATTKALDRKSEESRRPLLIQVDDIAEWRIFDHAEKLLKRFKVRQHGLDPLLVGVFPSPRIFTCEDQGRSTLFLHDPGLKISHTSSVSGDVEEDSCSVGPLDIIGQIYGGNIQDTLVRLLQKHGLSASDELE